MRRTTWKATTGHGRLLDQTRQRFDDCWSRRRVAYHEVGGKRRILIPPKLGYVDTALGPMPEMPWNRWKLNNLLDDMVAVAGGTIIFEVAMLSIVEDEADQGYYSDDSLVVTGGL